MPNYNIVSDVGEAIVRLLREGMVPEMIPGSEGIGVCHPSDHGDVNLCVCLYDIKRNTDIIPASGTPVGESKMRSPSVFVDLYYMITAFSSSDIKFRSLEESKILGRTIQLMEGMPVLRGETFGRSFTDLKYPPRIEMLDLETEEKHRIWNSNETPYKLSLFYKVYPIEIESERIRTVTRVTETDITFEQMSRQ